MPLHRAILRGFPLHLHLSAIYAYAYAYSYADVYGPADAHCPASHNTKGAALTTAAPGCAVRELRISSHFLKPSDASAWVSAQLKSRVNG